MDDEQITNMHELLWETLCKLSVDDIKCGIEHIADVLMMSNSQEEIEYESYLSFLKKKYASWNETLNGVVEKLSSDSSLEEDINTLMGLFPRIPPSYLEYYLLLENEYDAMYDSDVSSCNSASKPNMVLTANGSYVPVNEHVMYMKKLPQMAQKSEGWLKQRLENVTASEVGMVMGLTPPSWGTRNKLYVTKCGIPDPLSSPALDHGNKYEEVICQLYQMRTGKDVIEFGMIQHQGGNGIQAIPFFGASPDGISTDGVMLEIKAPWKRELTGNITPYYFSQVQHQMECCNLPVCDFIECRITDSTSMGGRSYNNHEDYLDDCPSGCDKMTSIVSKNGKEKGIIFQIN